MDSTDLHVAALQQNVPEIGRLLSLGVFDVNAINAYGWTPLHEAASRKFEGNRQFKTIEVLLKAGANANVLDRKNNTPLYYLTHNKASFETVELILNFGADVNVKNDDGATPLVEAIRSGSSLEVVKLLVDRGSDVNNVDKNGLMPLHLASAREIEIVKCLLEAGADANAQDRNGYTPLFYLVNRETTVRMVELILNFGAGVNVKNNDGSIPLVNAILLGKSFEVVSLLVDRGSDINNVDKKGLMPLHQASACKIEIIKRLLEAGADANAGDRNGWTPVMHFLSTMWNWDHHEITIPFLIKYSDVNVVDLKETNVLKFSCKKKMCEIFLSHFAKLRALDLPVIQGVIETISSKKVYEDYFNKCNEEMELAKKTKPKDCWINYFNLLVDSRRKLKNYAGNGSLIKDFQNSDCGRKFPIYGAEMLRNVKKGTERRKLFDKSVVMLSDTLPIFNPNHLIIRDILDCLTSKKDLRLFLKV